MAGGEQWVPVCIGVGSNLNDPVRQVRAAIAQLERLRDTRLRKVSGLYRSSPMGPADQPDYVNAAVAVLTRIEPRALLAALQEIETDLGRDRRRGIRWGPRCIDLDILTYGSRSIAEDGLTIPHPGISERNFVLFPLLEVAAEMDVPGLGPVRVLAANVDGESLERLED
ncbi:MAG: 2-amino-4-hydroxy-6-hydroxymethyldihydropteridine diphosphokinase [Gammaproteobacteria bacterium]